jgi:hypothetical protein
MTRAIAVRSTRIAEMTLRASASGWSTEEKTVIQHAGARQAVFLTLSRI